MNHREAGEEREREREKTGPGEIEGGSEVNDTWVLIMFVQN